MRLTAAFTAATIIATTAFAHDGQHDSWYESLQRPHPPGYVGPITCCSRTDCHETEAEIRGSQWWARLGLRQDDGTWALGAWVPVPATSVLLAHDNPTGSAVICHDIVWAPSGHQIDPAATSVWCFVPPAET